MVGAKATTSQAFCKRQMYSGKQSRMASPGQAIPSCAFRGEDLRCAFGRTFIVVPASIEPIGSDASRREAQSKLTSMGAAIGDHRL